MDRQGTVLVYTPPQPCLDCFVASLLAMTALEAAVPIGHDVPRPVHSRAPLSSFPRNSRLRGNDRESSHPQERRRRHGHGTAGVPPAHGNTGVIVRTSFCAKPSGASSCAKSQDAESMRHVDSASERSVARNDEIRRRSSYKATGIASVAKQSRRVPVEISGLLRRFALATTAQTEGPLSVPEPFFQ